MAMSGCGDDGDSTAKNGTESAGGSGSGTATSVPGGAGTGISEPSAESLSESGSPVPFVPGEVSAKLGSDGYPVGAVIHVTVSNGLDHPIYTEDSKTACSIVFLQRQDADSWHDIVGCRLGRPTSIVAIDSVLGRRIELDPTSFHLSDGTGRPAFDAGRYRVSFTYRVDPDIAAAEPMIAYSAEFLIH
jgi:hypothetical protein